MKIQNKQLRIIAWTFGSLNALILLLLFIVLFQFGDYLSQNLLRFLFNNLNAILYLAYLFLLISITATLLVKQRPKQEKYNVFSINALIFMLQVILNSGINNQLFG